MMDNGIYMIRNKVNGKQYIGSGIIEDRFYSHKYKLNRDIHENDHLQNSWNKHGSDNFEFEVLIYCSEDNLIFYEQKFIDYLFENYDFNEFYNIARDAKSPSKNRELSEEHKRKISEAISGEDHPMYGKSHDEESKEKMKESHKGKSLSKEHKDKLSQTLSGRHIKKETRKKISKAKTGTKHSEETKKKMRENRGGADSGFYGEEHTEETKKKMSEMKKGKNNPMYNKEHTNKTKERMSKLSKNEVIQVKKLLKNTDKTDKEISNIFDVSRKSINNIKLEKTWSHVSVDKN